MSSQKIDAVCFRLAMEASPAAMILVDTAGVIRFANDEAGRLFGASAEALSGRLVDEFVPAHLREGHNALRQDYLGEPSCRGMGAGRDLKAMRLDGAEFPVEIGLAPVGGAGEPLVLATIIDVSARRAAEAALEQRAGELETANQRLDRFAFVASHDLQEPLRKIAAFSDLLADALEEGDIAEARRANAVMHASALRARQLVDDLLTYSRMINEAQQLDRLDLKQEIELAIEDVSQLVEETGAVIAVDAPPTRVLADRSQFARLLNNILSNAIKYRKPGVPPKIDIAVTFPSPGMARLSITDNGIGFEAKYTRAIFEPFKRLHSKTQYPGTGIGLAICKSIADRHGWRLEVMSRPGEGATFCITMPVLA
jgi:PAS domain S-box-containing protein